MILLTPPYPPRGLKSVREDSNVEKPQHANGELAGMFSQIDELSLPGAGLRHLDFHSEMPMFHGIFTGDGTQSHMQVPPVSPSVNRTQSFVRTYGSEPEMYVLTTISCLQNPKINQIKRLL